jgi:hypothetical protein
MCADRRPEEITGTPLAGALARYAISAVAIVAPFNTLA